MARMVQTAAEPRRPDARNLALIREQVARISPDETALSDWYNRYAAQHAERLAFDLSIVERHAPKDAVVAEFGSVPPILTAALKAQGRSVIGLDIAPERFSGAIKALGLDVRTCNVETDALPLEDASCDVAIFNEIFEHLRIDPIGTLTEVRRILKPGGKLLLSTPNGRSLRNIQRLLVKGYGLASASDMHGEYEKLRTIGHMGHVREYPAPEVLAFLSKVGFSVEEMIRRGSYKPPLARLLTGAIPALRPHICYVATR